VEEPNERLDLGDIRNSLKSLMWRSVGVRRCKPDLVEALSTIATWQRYVLFRQFCEPAGWELQNMLAIARVIAQAALQREESRGVHYRTDFPQVDSENWKKRITFRRS
jgi:L-aspartate oxidase